MKLIIRFLILLIGIKINIYAESFDPSKVYFTISHSNTVDRTVRMSVCYNSSVKKQCSPFPFSDIANLSYLNTIISNQKIMITHFKTLNEKIEKSNKNIEESNNNIENLVNNRLENIKSALISKIANLKIPKDIMENEENYQTFLSKLVKDLNTTFQER